VKCNTKVVGDTLTRWGEGCTVRILATRCPRCGARMEQIMHARSGAVIVTRCRGVCR